MRCMRRSHLRRSWWTNGARSTGSRPTCSPPAPSCRTTSPTIRSCGTRSAGPSRATVVWSRRCCTRPPRCGCGTPVSPWQRTRGPPNCSRRRCGSSPRRAPRPQPLTEADGERFDAAFEVVCAGVQLLRRLVPATADDLLAHVSMLAVLKRETSGGVVSASSRYVPGIVLIDEPSTPIEVAEALVHEGAHEKFFDLAITREFLDARAEDAEWFETSWSHARWPLEQTFAAWHAYTCLAQFFTSCGAEQLGADSLLPKARERAERSAKWLLAHEVDLRADARRLLHGLMGQPCGDAARDRICFGRRRSQRRWAVPVAA